ncbi:GerAB/ArcD/ProY family transporter [Cohnella faecalis]|uniref:GerAB/ArcD/ProY family transporter n=1 Tax=Cohnella faecalis TaxID=2315694 RepID=UPI001F1B0E40|nr:endospore germination permease [Cohnella faecalis]
MNVTGRQIFWMILTMDLGMTLIMTMTPGAQAARQDMWMSIVLAGLAILLVSAVVTKVTLLHPGQHLIQLCRTILGKWVGTVVIVVYFVQWYTITPIVLRQFNDVLHVMILPTTPKLALMLIMVLLITYATVTGGIVNIARCSEVLGPIIVLMVVLVFAASLYQVNLHHLLPVFVDNGAVRIAKGALPPASYLGHAVEYLMLASFLRQPSKGAPYVYGAVAVTAFFVLISVMVTQATIGVELSTKMWYPYFEMARKISLFGFIENIDPVTIVIWVASVFIKLAIYLFVIAYGTAEFLGIKKWRHMAWINAPIILGSL